MRGRGFEERERRVTNLPLDPQRHLDQEDQPEKYEIFLSFQFEEKFEMKKIKKERRVREEIEIEKKWRDEKEMSVGSFKKIEVLKSVFKRVIKNKSCGLRGKL